MLMMIFPFNEYFIIIIIQIIITNSYKEIKEDLCGFKMDKIMQKMSEEELKKEIQAFNP